MGGGDVNGEMNMAHRSVWAVLAVAVVMAADAAADAMTKAEIEDELMGVTVSGVIEGEDLDWRECIDPAGQTYYQVEGERALRGQVFVTDAGLACFSYGAIASCFRVVREGPYYALVDAADRFLIQRVERPVRRCDGANDAIS
ncbi:MAG: hypothetical protein AAGJ32_08790 [Pseudomonadota bacterium]